MSNNLFVTAPVWTSVRLSGKHLEQRAQRQPDGTWRVTGAIYRKGRWLPTPTVTMNAEMINRYVDANAIAFRIG